MPSPIRLHLNGVSAWLSTGAKDPVSFTGMDGGTLVFDAETCLEWAGSLSVQRRER
ncbi:protein of unknown function [Candidatus Nitrospira inopinata]|uniref:Uncharacterized protein n=1 Tax=Candidatus Nitrospira inopinata TaxID=1715989 RepID=A0A0S4KRY8_9BACT|nr:protein of unknown function [Candidatus Nitrospira inopinata]